MCIGMPFYCILFQPISASVWRVAVFQTVSRLECHQEVFVLMINVDSPPLPWLIWAKASTRWRHASDERRCWNQSDRSLFFGHNTGKTRRIYGPLVVWVDVRFQPLGKIFKSIDCKRLGRLWTQKIVRVDCRGNKRAIPFLKDWYYYLSLGPILSVVFVLIHGRR